MNILWLEAAAQDLEALADCIAADNPKTAMQIFNGILHTVEKLKAYPFLGREGRVDHTRELIMPHLPFIVVYTVTKEIRILAVLHTSRKWPEEFGS